MSSPPRRVHRARNCKYQFPLPFHIIFFLFFLNTGLGTLVLAENRSRCLEENGGNETNAVDLTTLTQPDSEQGATANATLQQGPQRELLKRKDISMLPEDERKIWQTVEDPHGESFSLIGDSPMEECNVALLEQIGRWSRITAQGGTLLEALRRNRTYRNPEYLRKKVDEFGIDQYGTTLPSHIFDPYNLPQEDTIVALREKCAEEESRKKAARAASIANGSARIGFESAPTQPMDAAKKGSSSGQISAAAIAAAQAKAAALARDL